MNKTLLRNDIVGHRIKNIWVTEWEKYEETIDEEPFYNMLAYVELESNAAFVILGCDPYVEYAITTVDIAKLNVHKADSPQLTNCIGKTIIEVLTSNYVPTFCLLLEDHTILYCSMCSPDSFGPIAAPLEKNYAVEDFATYWGHNPISLNKAK